MASKLAAKAGLITLPTDEARWRYTFEAHAKETKAGLTLTVEDFVSAVCPARAENNVPRSSYRALFRVADSRKRGYIDWDDYRNFQTLLSRPDADYQVAFLFFDKDGSGSVDLDELNAVYKEQSNTSLPFDVNCDWIKLFLGRSKRIGDMHVLKYIEFTQLMKGFQGERLRQAFAHLDQDQDGLIHSNDFKRIITELHGHKLSATILDRLPTLTTLSPGGNISYSEVVAFHNVIKELDSVEHVLQAACEASKDGFITSEDFLNTAQRTTRYSLFTPLEASIVFHLAGNPQGRMKKADFAPLLDPRWMPPTQIVSQLNHANEPPHSFVSEVLANVYHFVLGGIAGAFGATIVYPIDLVKTRMQNQRNQVVGQLMYKNSLDCVRKVYANEGLRGFYSGLLPQLVGVAPEKAIKLVVNGFVRSFFTDPVSGSIPLPAELLSGAMAGASQCVVTNPLEVVKIRLQMQGEMSKATGTAPRGAVNIVKQLGLLGLYKGAGACLMRDIPFSAIYFTGYAHLKKDVFGEGKNDKRLGIGETLLAAGIAGMPAAYLTTPADVVKTRLQSEAKAGHTTYNGIIDAFRKIRAEEGISALYKGGGARVIRSSPQFAATLTAFEWLNQTFPWHESDKVTAQHHPDEAELAHLRARNSLKILLDVQQDIGSR